MEDVLRWLDHQVKRERRVLYLEDALLGRRFPAYAFYRLRYFFLRFLTGCVTHALRFVLILHVAGEGGFAGVLVLHAVVSLAGSFWWGLLEEMRGGVRSLRRTGRPHLIPNEIGRWLTLSIHLAILVSVGGLIWIGAASIAGKSVPSVLEVYALTVVFGFALNLVTRCYHSGIYALRRVYRPPLMIILAEVVSFVAFLAFWPWIGAWSLPLASILSSLVVAVLTVYYSRKAYTFFGFRALERVRLGRPWMLRRSATRPAGGGALAFALMRLDSLLLLTLFFSGLGGERDGLFLLLFMLSPIIHAALDWARLFYFDLKRLEIRFLRNVRRRFQGAVIGLAAVLGVGYWLFALIYAVVLGRSLGDLAAPLGLFMVGRSLLAAYQIQMFSERAYRDVVAAGLALLLGFALVPFVPGDPGRLLLLSALNVAALAFLWWRSASLGPGPWGGSVLWPAEWLAEVAAIGHPVRITSGRVLPPPNRERVTPEPERGPIPWVTRQIVERIGRRLRGGGRVTFLSENRFVWYESRNGRRRTHRSWFLRQGFGLVRWMGSSGLRQTGMRALETATDRKLLAPLSTILGRSPRIPVSLEEARREFKCLIPQGLIYDPSQPIPEALKDMESQERRRILYAAGAYLRMLEPWSPGSRYEVTALSAQGELSLVFIADRRAGRKARRQWLARVREYNIRAGVWGASQ
jgi:hypothetical protein